MARKSGHVNFFDKSQVCSLPTISYKYCCCPFTKTSLIITNTTMQREPLDWGAKEQKKSLDHQTRDCPATSRFCWIYNWRRETKLTTSKSDQSFDDQITDYHTTSWSCFTAQRNKRQEQLFDRKQESTSQASQRPQQVALLPLRSRPTCWSSLHKKGLSVPWWSTILAGSWSTFAFAWDLKRFSDLERKQDVFRQYIDFSIKNGKYYWQR